MIDQCFNVSFQVSPAPLQSSGSPVHLGQVTVDDPAERISQQFWQSGCRSDFRRIAEYRARHLKHLQTLFLEVLVLCREAGLAAEGRQHRTNPDEAVPDPKAQRNFTDPESKIMLTSNKGFDLGARALLEGVQVHANERILDVGCGSGAVGLALALRQPGVKVHGLDANPRAAQCILQGGALNGLEVAEHIGIWDESLQVTSSVDDSGHVPALGAFDLAVGNPPYFSNFKIAEIFLQAALRGVRGGGRIAMVTQEPEWFVARMKQLFKGVSTAEHRGYIVVSAVRK